MNLKRIISGVGLLAIMAAALGMAPRASLAAPLAQSGNLLQNPGVEQPYTGNKQAESWGRWFQEIPKPGDASGLQYAVAPNFSAETNPSGSFPGLIHGGATSQHIGQSYDPWIAGIKQPVVVPPNTPLRFCAWSRIRISNADIGKANSESVAAYNGRSKVGIFPNGDAEWNTPGIVWSGEINPHDTWGQVCTEATSGPTGKVMVFTSNDWRGGAAVHIDAWWDDAELTVTGPQPTATPDAGNQPAVIQPTSAPVQAQPTVPPVTNPDGSVVHTIVSGDTLFGLALQYNTTLEEILRLNNIAKDSLLSIGQKIIVKAGSGGQPAVQPTTTPAAQQPTPASGVVTGTQPAPQPTVAPTQVANASASKLCVRAFDDANGDGLVSADETAVVGVQFAVANAQGVQAASYTSDDSVEPHCFTDLQPGSYTVAVQPASGTVATSDKRWGVALTGGSTININFGSRAEGQSTAGPQGSDTASGAAQNSSSGSSSGLGGLLTGAIGLIVLLVAGVLGAFVIARRRA